MDPAGQLGLFTLLKLLSILRNGLDVDFGVRAGLSARNMIHLCVATNPRPLKHHGLCCYLSLKVAIGELNLKIMFSKTAQVVLVENYVPPQALCLTRKSPSDLGSYCLPRQEDLIKPRGRDADSVPIKEVSKIFIESRPRPCSVLVLLLDQRLLRLRQSLGQSSPF